MSDDNIPDIIPPDGGNMGDLGMREAGGNLSNQARIGVSMQNFLMSAQPVDRARVPSQIMQRLKTLCKMHGQRYIYSWKVTDRANQRQIEISGATVKLTNDLAAEYGNMVTGIVNVEDVGTHWIFHAAVCDMETGYNYIRPFRQRKGQDTGMKDRDRQEDIVFQIGCSKAIRNAVTNVLGSWVEYMLEECDTMLIEWVQNKDNQQKLQSFIDKTCARFSIKIEQIEAVIGRSRADWSPRDKVKVMSELRGVAEGLTNPADLYPSDEDAEKVRAKKDADRAQQKSGGKAPPPRDERKDTEKDTSKAEEPPKEEGKKGPGRPAMSAEEKAMREEYRKLTGKKVPAKSNMADVQRLVEQEREKAAAQQEAAEEPPSETEQSELPEEPKNEGGSGAGDLDMPNFAFTED